MGSQSVACCFVQVTVYLTSPAGTRSTLLTQRAYDRSADGFNFWSFMTTHCWGESPNGVWTLEVRNGNNVGEYAVWMYADREMPEIAGDLKSLLEIPEISRNLVDGCGKFCNQQCDDHWSELIITCSFLDIFSYFILFTNKSKGHKGHLHRSRIHTV